MCVLSGDVVACVYRGVCVWVLAGESVCGVCRGGVCVGHSERVEVCGSVCEV